MNPVDWAALFGSTSPAIAFGLLCFYFMSQVYRDALRREKDYSETLHAYLQEQMTVHAQYIERLTQLERNLHEVKNALQRITLETERDRRTTIRRGEENGDD